MIITCGQVPFASWYSPGGFKTMRSAPDVLLQSYLETWSLGWETLGWGTFLAPGPNDITFLFLSIQPLFAFFPFFVNFLLCKWGSSACMRIWLTLTTWWMDLRFVSRRNHFYLLYTCSFLNHIHFSPTTWTPWHHLGLLLIISSLQLWWMGGGIV